MSSKLKTFIAQNPFFLAPMAGITDRAFRSFMREMGCGVVTTELVSATGLRYSSEKTRQLMTFDSTQHPVGIQFFGEELEHLNAGAQVAEQMGADFVDLNFGCPVPKVVNKGGGSAILKDLTQVKKVFQSVRAAVKIPVTVKVRTGWDLQSRNTLELAEIAAGEGIEWVAIHGRTRAQGYSGQADWEYISEVSRSSRLPIIGNGDINHHQQAVDRLRESGCAGVMIGRGCLKNPWIFQEANLALQGESFAVERNFVEAFERLETHLQAHSPERIVNLQLRKFAAWFSSGYPNASSLRKQIFADVPLNDLRRRIQDFFGPLHAIRPADTSHESFLMGGHG